MHHCYTKKTCSAKFVIVSFNTHCRSSQYVLYYIPKSLRGHTVKHFGCHFACESSKKKERGPYRKSRIYVCMYVVLDRTKIVGWLDRYKLPLHTAAHIRLHTYIHADMLILTSSTSLTLLLYFQATDGEIGKVFGQTRLRKKILGWVSRIQVVL